MEMTLVSDVNLFFNASQTVWNNILSTHSNITQQRGVIFVGTEDKSALLAAEKWGVEHDWKVLYTDLFDRDKVVLLFYNWLLMCV